MKLKQRLMLTNLSLLLIPTAVTLLIAFIALYLFTIFAGSKISYNDFENTLKIRYEMFSAAETIWKNSPDSLASPEFGAYLASKMNDTGTEVFITRDDEILFRTSGILPSDILIVKEEGPSLINNTVQIGGISYYLQKHEFTGKDPATISIYLLIPTDSKIKSAELFIILLLASFIISGLIVSVAVTNKLLKNIAAPVTKLNKAVFEISEGNLSDEIAEDGADEIKELFRSVEKMRIKLQESVKNREITDINRQTLISNISHDLKTPITSIKGYVEGIRDNIADTEEKKKKYLDTIYIKAVLMDKMIDDLVFFSKLELGKAPYNFEVTDPVAYFSDCVEENFEDMKQSDISLEFENELQGAFTVLMDRERMKRVMQNLLENAKKYRKEKAGSVKIKLRSVPGRVIIEVRDTGLGIPKENLPFVFERFYRADNSRGRVSGSGLGLSIAKQIVEDHKGSVWVVSKENEGASFMISLNTLSSTEEV